VPVTAAALPAPDQATEPVRTADFFNSCRIAAGVLVFLLNFLQIFGFTAIFTAIFALMYRLVGGRVRRLTTGGYWKIGVYAGFPVTAVAACFPAFQLPLLTYTTVYMVGTAVYWMIAATRVEAELRAAELNNLD